MSDELSNVSEIRYVVVFTVYAEHNKLGKGHIACTRRVMAFRPTHDFSESDSNAFNHALDVLADKLAYEQFPLKDGYTNQIGIHIIVGTDRSIGGANPEEFDTGLLSLQRALETFGVN